MARLLADECFSFPVVELLREFGHDVITVLELNRAGISWPDEEALEFAAATERAVLTFNRDHFFALHKKHPAHRGIIACTENPDIAGLAERIDTALRTAGDLRGKVIRIYKPNR